MFSFICICYIWRVKVLWKVWYFLSFPSSVVNNITLVAWNWPWWGCSHHENQQVLQTWALIYFFLERWLLKFISTPLPKIHKSQASTFCNKVGSVFHTRSHLLAASPQSGGSRWTSEVSKRLWEAVKKALSLFRLSGGLRQKCDVGVGCRGRRTPDRTPNSRPLSPWGCRWNAPCA